MARHLFCTVLLAAGLCMAACQKYAPLYLIPSPEIKSLTLQDYDAARIVVRVMNFPDSAMLLHGICWAAHPDPDLRDNWLQFPPTSKGDTVIGGLGHHRAVYFRHYVRTREGFFFSPTSQLQTRGFAVLADTLTNISATDICQAVLAPDGWTVLFSADQAGRAVSSLVKLGPDASEVWSLRFDGTSAATIPLRLLSYENGYLVALATHGNKRQGIDLVRVSENGGMLWRRSFDAGTFNQLLDVSILFGSVKLTLRTCSDTTSAWCDDAKIVEEFIDPYGYRTNPLTGTTADPRLAAQSPPFIAFGRPDGSLHLIGTGSDSATVPPSDNIFLNRLHLNRLSLCLSFGGPGSEKAKGAVQTGDGGLIVAGLLQRNYLDVYQAWVFATDAQMQMRWQQYYRGAAFGPDGHTYPAGISAGIEEATYLYGTQQPRNQSAAQGFIAKFDRQGRLIWDYALAPDGDKKFGSVRAVAAQPDEQTWILSIEGDSRTSGQIRLVRIRE